MDKLDFSVIQLNMNKAFVASVELNNTLTRDNHYLGLLTEPYVGHGKPCNLPSNMDAIYKDDNPRALILSNRLLHCKSIPGLCDRDHAVGLINIRNQKILIASIYMDITKDIPDNKLKDRQKSSCTHMQQVLPSVRRSVCCGRL